MQLPASIVTFGIIQKHFKLKWIIIKMIRWEGGSMSFIYENYNSRKSLYIIKKSEVTFTLKF